MQNQQIKPNYHEYTIEHLYHFRCGYCSQWWSIGDFNVLYKRELICPNCGEQTIIKEFKKDK